MRKGEFMAEVGTKRSPRLPKGPKPLEESDNVVIEADEEVLDGTPARTDNKTSTGNTDNGVNSRNSSDSNVGTNNFQEIEKRPKLPEPPSKVIREHQVSYDYMAQLKPEHWLQVIWYLYRLDPKIIRPDGEEYIDKGSHALTEDYILENFGSGEYQLKFNDVGKPKNAKNVFTAYFRYNLPDKPPKVNMAELDVDAKVNRRFVDQCITKGLLTVDRKPMNTIQPQGVSNDAIVNLLGKMIDKLDRTQINNASKDPRDAAISEAFAIMGKGNEAATRMMLEQMKENSPDTLIKLVTLIMGMMPKQDNKSDDGMLMKFISIMNDKDKTMMDMMNKMMEMTIKASQPKEGQTNNSEDSFDKFMDRFSKMADLMGLTGGGGGGKKSTLEVALQYGMPAVERAFGIIQNLLALKASGVQPITNNGQGQQTRTNQPTLPVTTSTSEVTAEDTEATTVNTNNNGGAGMGINEDLIKRGVLELAPKIVEAMNRDTSGDAFADSINTFLGPQAYDMIAGLGEEKILECIKSVPQVWALFSMREPALKKFIKDFISYGNDEELPTGGEGEGETVKGIVGK